jgi:hypothetical protein
MGGFVGPERLTKHVDGQLEANVVALEMNNASVVFVSIDTLFVGAEMTSRIQADCAARFGVAQTQTLVLASHTHFAPMLDSAKPRIGLADPSEVDRCAGLISTALRSETLSARSCVARVGNGLSDASVNRRLTWRLPNARRLLGRVSGDVYMCDNPLGPRDPRVRSCTWLADGGEPLAILWSFACHPVGYPTSHTASADYVGRVREALRRSMGKSVPVVFAPGCMGDVWPRSPDLRPAPERLLSLALYGPTLRPMERQVWDHWAERFAAEVVAIEAGGRRQNLDAQGVVPTMAKMGVTDLIDGESPVPELHAKSVTAPGVGRIVALSCEPVTEIAALVARPDDLVLGYEGDVFGYLPTDAMVAEGGYEPKQSLPAFNLTGRFRQGIDQKIVSLCAQLT